MAGRPGAGQRQRLIEAMTVVASRHGYGEASVARVIRQAGMSRATFYEHFEDRDACLLAAFRSAAAALRDELEAAERGGGAELPREVLRRTLALAEKNPGPTRLVLTEAMAGDAVARSEREELLLLVEDSIDAYLDAAAERGAPIEIPARALLGGIGNLIGSRIFRHEAGGLEDLLEDLLAWFASYSLPPGHRRLTRQEWFELGHAWSEIRYEPPRPPREERPLPRGRSALSPGQVASEHRERVVEAIAVCLGEKGYRETTVADLVASAGITRAAFYEQFRSKEDAFLSAQALGLERSASLVAARFFTEASWPERVWNSAEALVGYIADHADLARASVVESYAVGPAGIRRSYESRMAYTLFLEDGYRQRPEAEALPRVCSEAISGGTEELLRRQIVLGRTERTQELLPQAVYFMLAPFIGAEAALELVRERCRRAA